MVLLVNHSLTVQNVRPVLTVMKLALNCLSYVYIVLYVYYKLYL